jgi:cbb3-type cytochrome oxidase subunit 1
VGRFILFAALAYLVSGALGILLGFRSVSLITHFTYAPVAVTLLHLMGFVGMALLAVIYYVVPRVLGLSWDTRWMQAHFLLATVGTGLIFLALFAGGLVQGLRLNNTTTPFVDVVKTTVPFVGLATGGWMLLLIAQGLFLWQLGGLLARFTRPARLAAWAFLSGADLPQAEVRA